MCRYCIKNYDPDNEQSRGVGLYSCVATPSLPFEPVLCPLASQVYMHLIKLHLSPPNFVDYDILLPDGFEPNPSVKEAFKVLIAHYDIIDIRKVGVM